jgi:hypothetical protein
MMMMMLLLLLAQCVLPPVVRGSGQVHRPALCLVCPHEGD